MNNEVHSFNNTLKLWNKHKYHKSDKKKLTISLVSNLTNIPFETTRRRVLKLSKKKWIYFSKIDGITLNTASELNNIIVNKIHPHEKNLLKEFLISFLLAGSDD